MNEETKVKVYFILSSGYGGAEHKDEFEITIPNYENMTEEQIDQFLHQCWLDWANNYIDGSYKIIKDE